jgi:hypothetical protein
MLLGLLPGFRDLRAPLVCGAAWLVVCWFAVASSLPPEDQATGSIAKLYRLVDLGGKPLTVAALAVIAYLVGTVSLAVTRLFVDWGNQLTALRGLRWINPGPRTYRDRESRLILFVIDRLADRTRDDSNLLESLVQHWFKLSNAEKSRARLLYDATDAHEVRARAEADLQARRDLVWASTDLQSYAESLEGEFHALEDIAAFGNDVVYDRVDRLISEAEFKRSMVGPLGALALLLALTASVFWIILLVLPVTLMYLAERDYNRGMLVLVSALETGAIKSPLAEEIVDGPLRFRDVAPR